MTAANAQETELRVVWALTFSSLSVYTNSMSSKAAGTCLFGRLFAGETQVPYMPGQRSMTGLHP